MRESSSGMRELSYVCYGASGVSIILSIAAWARAGGNDRNHGEHWGLFVGLWAPTFAAAGVALALEATRHEGLKGT